MRVVDISSVPRRLDRLTPRILIVSAVVAIVGLGGAWALASGSDGGGDHLLETYLVSYAFYLSLALGALFFVLLQHVTRSGWGVVIRRIAEAMATNVWLMVLLLVPIVLGLDHLYHWAHAGAADHDPILQGKMGFLNPTFFMIRMAVYFALWSAMAWFFHRSSVRQDSTGDPATSVRMERVSAPGMIVFALSINFAAFDLLMSLDPHWFSTIFGVYFFSGSVVAFFAVMPKVMAGLQKSGVLTGAVTVEHYHDIGKLLFAFVVFWAYIAFSQFMLIWYANLPEETGWFLKRFTGDWLAVSWALLIGHFAIPFVVLVSRFVKRRPLLLAIVGAWVLAMHWMDLYWLVIPEFSPGVTRFGLIDVLVFLGMGGLFNIALALRLRRHSLIPEQDPRLRESLAFENA